MLKQLIFLVIVSTIVILFSAYVGTALHFFLQGYTMLTDFLGQIFSTTQVGVTLTKLVALLLVPFAVAGIIEGIYRILKRKGMPIFYEVLWMLWVMLATMFVVIR